MIFDRLIHADVYKTLGPRFKVAFEFFEADEVRKLEPGRHEIDGDRLLVDVHKYTSKNVKDSVWEAHRRYVDIQLVLDGCERIDYAHLDKLTEVTPYDPQKDAAFFKGEGLALTVETGMFALFFPHDGHCAGLAVDEPSPVHKAVAKVLLDV